MSVPNNYNFSLQDVVNEISGSQDDLVECFAEASASGFDSSYSGSKNSLRNFRNYNETPFIPALNISPTSYSTGSGATSFTITISSNTTWSVSDNAPWMRSTSSGSGNGSVRITLGSNTGSGRYGTVIIRTTSSTGTNITRSCIVEQTGSGPGGNL